MRIVKLSLGLAAALFGLTTIGCSEDEPAPAVTPQATTVVDVAVKAGNFTTLVAALKQTGLDQTLAGTGPFTVFAPTDEAFARLPAGVVASLDAATLTKILTYHVHPGKASASAIVGLSSAPTVQGEAIGIGIDAGTVYLNGTAKVVTTDLAAENGLIHVIDSVLLPPSIAFPGTVVDQLKSSPRFSTLVGAVVSAELATTLAGDNGGPGFTVFAPTDAAFKALGADLSTLDKAALSGILLYHVAGSKVPAATVVTLTSAPTLAGKDVAIAVKDGTVTLNGKAKVIQTDLKSSNGIVHVIDAVLTP